jgi:hypothetical protein
MARQILEDFSASAVITAIEQNFIASTLAYVRTVQGYISEEPQLTWVFTGTPLHYYNGVIHTTLTTADPDASIMAVLDFFRARRQLMTWWISPSTYPHDLPHRLEAQGLTRRWQDVGMAADLQRIPPAHPAPPGLMIERATDEETTRQWIRALGHGFAMSEAASDSYRQLVMAVPPDRHPIAFYIARLAGEPVATSSLYYAAGVAGIADVCTIPSARRQGIGAAITLAPMRDGLPNRRPPGVADG